MSSFPFDIVAFDLDGTLADTAPDIAAGINRMLADFGRPLILVWRAAVLVYCAHLRMLVRPWCVLKWPTSAGRFSTRARRRLRRRLSA